MTLVFLFLLPIVAVIILKSYRNVEDAKHGLKQVAARFRKVRALGAARAALHVVRLRGDEQLLIPQLRRNMARVAAYVDAGRISTDQADAFAKLIPNPKQYPTIRRMLKYSQRLLHEADRPKPTTKRPTANDTLPRPSASPQPASHRLPRTSTNENQRTRQLPVAHESVG